MKSSSVPLETHLKRLHLANAPRIYRELAERAEREQWSYQDFLATLVGEEIAHRQQTRLQRLVRRAHFPFLKTIDEFDFTYQSVLRLSMLGSCLSADFVTEGRCVIFSGKAGRGKTHLAVAMAYRAIQNGFDALFTTAAELIDDLSSASREGRLREALVAYTHPSVIVIDEVGYLTYGTDAANVLFHVVNDRHLRRKAMIFTTNKELAAWGRVQHDPDLAAAIVDRVLERGRLFKLDGPSHRTRHLGLDDPTSAGVSTQPVRISGIHLPEFSEPTTVARVRALRERLGIPNFVPSSSEKRRYISIDEAASRLGICAPSVHRLIRGGVLHATQQMPYAPWEVPVDALATEVVRDRSVMPVGEEGSYGVPTSLWRIS